jgi:hypothetical protein
MDFADPETAVLRRVTFLASDRLLQNHNSPETVSAEPCEQVKRNRKNQSRHDRHRLHNGARFKRHLRRCAPWLWEMRSAIVARVRDRNPMEIADDLGHRFWRLRPYGRPLARNAANVKFNATSSLYAAASNA